MKIKLVQKPKKYSKINQKTRKILVQKVIFDKKTMASTARLLKIKQSTAKAIINKFKLTGTVFVKKSDQLKKNSEEIQHNILESNDRNTFLQIEKNMEVQKRRNLKLKPQNKMFQQSLRNNSEKNDLKQCLNAWRFHFQMTMIQDWKSYYGIWNEFQ